MYMMHVLNNLGSKDALCYRMKQLDRQEIGAGVAFVVLQLLLLVIITTLIHFGPENWGALP